MMTNAEWIRNMTDEELAEYICVQGWMPAEVQECIEWLKREWSDEL